MTTSAARLEANRQNALKSTGPKTAEGKAASRLNAFKHGMAGQGDVVGPEDDVQLVAERAAAFGRELAAVGGVGQLLAHRAALLSVRMERLAVGELIAVQAAERRGRAEFAADRGAAIDEWLAAAETPGADPTEALAALAGGPDGLDRLGDAWRALLGRLRSTDPGTAAEVAARWLGRTSPPPDAEHPPISPADLASAGEAEVHRLGVLSASGSMTSAAQAIEQARINAGIVARFDPGPEATRARRYEAAAERGMYRAIRAIAEINRQTGRTGTESSLADLQSSVALLKTATIPSHRPEPTAARSSPLALPERDERLAPMGSFRAAPAEALGSFRAGVVPPAAGTQPARIGTAGLDPSSPEARRRRPDPRKLAEKLAANRR